ncbi:TIGR00266 family protein, partial [candidate division TA06 bacterium]
MEHEVLYRSAYALLRVKLEKGEAISAEAGAMVSMSSGVALQTTAKGGLFGALKRSMLGGESFFLNTFTADEGGEMTLAPTLPGDVLSIELGGET